MRQRLSPAVFSLLLLVPAWGVAKEVPYLTGRVVDEARLLSPEQLQRIEARLEDFERRTTNQVAVLTVDSLEGEDIAGFAHKVGSTWKLGAKGKDNGVLLLVSKGDRKMRMEVGYGLEPVLTDLQTNIIQNEVIIPHFKQDDYGGGIEAGVDAIIATAEGKEVQPAPAQPPAGRRGGKDLGFLPFLLLLLVPFSLDALRSRSWLLYIFLMPFYFFLGFIITPVLGIIAAGLWAVLFPILRMVLPKSMTRGRRGGGGFLGPWMGGGGGWGGGGGGWSGGGGGGGFSGGGGSFGGGGSSSSW